MALRYLHASKGSRYVSWITLLSISGLALGVTALILVLSVFNGFEHEVRYRLLQANAHIIASVYPAGLNDPPKWMATLKNDRVFGQEITALSPFIHSESLAKNGSAMVGIMVRGIHPSLQNKVQSLDGLIQPPSALKALQDEMDYFHNKNFDETLPLVIVGSGLLKTLNLKVGMTLEILSPKLETLATTKRFKVIGTYNSGLKQYDDKSVILSLPVAQDFTGMGTRVVGFTIGIKDPDQSTLIAETMRQRYSALTVKEWQSLNARFFEIMSSERVRVGLLVGLVCLVAGFNILTTVFVSVSQKQSDISILKAIGASNPQILRVFLYQSLAIGCVGALIGALLAYLITLFLQNYPLLELPDPYFLKTLPVRPTWLLYGGMTSSAIVVCLIAGLYPAWVASRVTPSEGFRGTGKAL